MLNLVNGVCSCGNSRVLLNGLCGACQVNIILQSEATYVDMVDVPRASDVNTFVIMPVFTRKNNADNMAKVVKFLQSVNSEIDLFKNFGTTNELSTNDKKYVAFTVKIPNGISKEEFEFVSRIIMSAKGVLYDMKYDEYDWNKKFSSVMYMKDEQFTTKEYGNILVLLERYGNILKRLTIGKVESYVPYISTMERLNEVKNLKLKEVGEYLVEKADKIYYQESRVLQLLIGRATLNSNLLTQIEIVKAMIKLSKELTQEKLDTMKSERIFVDMLLSLIPSELQVQVKDLLVSRNCYIAEEQSIQNFERYFGDDYHEGGYDEDDDDYDSDDDYYDED